VPDLKRPVSRFQRNDGDLKFKRSSASSWSLVNCCTTVRKIAFI